MEDLAALREWEHAPLWTRREVREGVGGGYRSREQRRRSEWKLPMFERD